VYWPNIPNSIRAANRERSERPTSPCVSLSRPFEKFRVPQTGASETTPQSIEKIQIVKRVEFERSKLARHENNSPAGDNPDGKCLMFALSLPFSDFTDFFLESILLVAYRYERRFLISTRKGLARRTQGSVVSPCRQRGG
jgi:hypothetical protein